MKLYVVGIGPGNIEGMTAQAKSALEKSEVIFGYTAYIELVKPHFAGKEYIATPMRSELERCRMALEAAREQNVAMVCSGDAGVYGMAGPLYELCENEPQVDLEVIAGVTAAQSGAALVGAPLMRDYAVISLSDLLVDWGGIEKRLKAAAMGDFATVLYNAGSHRRKEALRKACDIMLEHKGADTVCAVAESIGREGEGYEILTLSALREKEVSMNCTVFIGTSQTVLINQKMVEKRGYEVRH